jgi:hypothetical protein
MNSRFNFIEYLTHLKDFADLEYERKSQVQNARWSPTNIYGESLKKIQAAREGQIGELGRAFNEFPVSYTIEEKDESVDDKIYYAFDPRIQSRWLDLAKKIITSNEFDSIPHPEMPEEPELNQTVLNQGSQIEATKMMQEMIQESVSILLDANGNVSPSIAEVLGIQDLVVSVDPNHLDVMMSGEDRQKQKMASVSSCILIRISNHDWRASWCFR